MSSAVTYTMACVDRCLSERGSSSRIKFGNTLLDRVFDRLRTVDSVVYSTYSDFLGISSRSCVPKSFAKLLYSLDTCAKCQYMYDGPFGAVH